MRWIWIEDVQEVLAINVLGRGSDKRVVFDRMEKEWILRPPLSWPSAIHHHP